MTISIDGTNGVTLDPAGMPVSNVTSINGGQLAGLRNRIINGDMRIDQRNAGAAVTLTTSIVLYAADRFACNKGTAGATAAVQQQAASLPSAGFEKCNVYSVSVGAAPAAGDLNVMYQVIEGYNVQDLQWGTANAKTITVSFWAKQTVAGTYGFSINSTSVARSYVQTFTITAPNVWQYFSITIPGDTTGTYAKDNTAGMYITWDMGSGTSAETTAGSWQAGNFKRTSACAKQIQATGTFYLTGVQVEVGSTATAFEFRPIGMELALCQRYYQASGSAETIFSGNVTNAQLYYMTVRFPVPMRATPTTISVTNTAATSFPAVASTPAGSSTAGFYLSRTANASAYGQWQDTWTASAEL